MGELGESSIIAEPLELLLRCCCCCRLAFSGLHSDRKVDVGREWRRVRRRSEEWAVSEEVPELSEESGMPNRL